ncbi:renin receptor isoform X1 [Trichogramma pretiosum]|uniref:renin receptor isoform X1 n=1 Tax=Trichogramma pretiosum TaxID=7493 RepID=UPI0006C9B275|nr:renin receptor isoform X1 [Trichogramma pretiosum]
MIATIFAALAAFVVLVQGNGDFVVLHTPDNVIFKGSKEIDQSNLKEVFSAALGYTVKHQKQSWSGLSITSPFDLPEAVVAIAVEGVDSLGAIKGKKYPLLADEVEEATWQNLRGRLEQRDNDNLLVRIYLGDGLDALGQSALGELKPTPIDESQLKALSSKNEQDHTFLEEVQLLRAIAKKVPTAVTADNKPDVYWLVVSGLKPIFEAYGKNSVAAKEALALLNEALHEVSKAFMDVYKNQVLITAFTNDPSQVHSARPKRQVSPGKSNFTESPKGENSEDEDKENKEPLKPEDINIAQTNEDYPVIFNICLWFGVAIFFALLAICISIADMDPGRDSIIYRMTSNRMKKDN